MSKLPTGNCPYCDAARGVNSAWGMSPQGWGDMKDEHDAGHPRYVEQSKQLSEEILSEIKKI